MGYSVDVHLNWKTLVTTLLLTLLPASSIGAFNLPRNVSRLAGSTNIQTFCSKDRAQATPFWKINDTIYYFSEVPPLFIPAPDGRSITIPVVDISYNQTSFQCFVPTTDGQLFSSSVGILTVIVTDLLQNVSHNSTTEQVRLTLDHQSLYFDRNVSVIAWKVSGLDHSEVYFELKLTDRCSSTSDVHTETLVNSTRLSFQPASLLGVDDITSYDLNLTMYDTQQIKTTSMEVLRLHPQIRTETIPVTVTDPNCTSAAPSCIDVPPLTGTQTLVMAVPFSLMDDFTPDILCPIHPASDERCVDLLSCSHFSESVFANSLTICRIANNDSILEMCLHNVSEALNETKVHFFYSDIMCNPDGNTPESSRTYISSMQLIIKDHQGDVQIEIRDTTDEPKLCIVLECFQGKFEVTIVNESDSGCSVYTSHRSANDCIPAHLLSINKECSQTLSLLVKVEGELRYKKPLQEIPDFESILTNGSSSECRCSQGGEGPQTIGRLAIAIAVFVIIALVIVTLITIISIVTVRNIKLLHS